MDGQVSIALAQLNPCVGDIKGNEAKILFSFKQAHQQGADLIIFPELMLTGYGAKDLMFRRSFQDHVKAAIYRIAAATKNGPGILLGTLWYEKGVLKNVALYMEGGKIRKTIVKQCLPNTGVFDEKRYFTSEQTDGLIRVKGVSIGVMICFDMWSNNVAQALKEKGAQLLIALNASPFDIAKKQRRLGTAQLRVKETKCPFIYVNMVGGQDEIVFDGTSFVLNKAGQMAHLLPSWQTELRVTTWENSNNYWAPIEGELTSLTPMEDIYQAMMLGLRDYAAKNNFERVFLGLSGGVDSALSAAVAVDALGASKVKGFFLPSKYTSHQSREDALQCAGNLEMPMETVPIHDMVAQINTTLVPHFKGQKEDVTEENIQARARGLVLMAMANKYHALVLTTGNKSELAVGYTTLYGDMCGGYNVLKDLYKTKVYEIARWRNKTKPHQALGPEEPIIPSSVLTKPASAELRPNQTDQDTLPPYNQLDMILIHLLDLNASIEDVVKLGFDEKLVRKIWRMVLQSEYKRFQAAPGVKISSCHLTLDRRYPLTNGCDE